MRAAFCSTSDSEENRKKIDQIIKWPNVKGQITKSPRQHLKTKPKIGDRSIAAQMLGVSLVLSRCPKEDCDVILGLPEGSPFHSYQTKVGEGPHFLRFGQGSNL